MSLKQEQLNKLIGTWRLVEVSNLDPITMDWIYPYGKNPQGYVTYSKGGVVTANISAEKPLAIPVESAETLNLTLAQLTEYYVGYFGTYVVDVENSIVIHSIIGSTIPWLIGSADPRPFILNDNLLFIGDNKTWRRTFERVD